ncbi:tRNA (adenosine(37)-N6)-threonylcarbamoyltransferase complex ATPase subunit type 1 TsaE [Candidatus Peregrinibacteria bacterium]|nr:MAG: tRNA (adenosine(37)-N6)-threonylcarbamoyltransferase complex ATPase subunit type 1 TsaE [Candidatus Peregrinibacteria bacterium]
MQAIYHTQSTDQTIELGKRLGETLKPGQSVLLFGNLGAGKTQFSKGIAAGMGIKETIKSPTFAYVNQYQLNPLSGPPSVFYHYDLYRLQKGDDLHSIGLEESISDNRAINVIEWADRLAHWPSERIEVHFKIDGEDRTIAVEHFSSQVVTEAEVKAHWEKWITPLHVRAHCAQVASVATQIAQAYADQGEIVNMNLVNTAALLHDVCRVCDFKTMEKENFSEEITSKQWNAWLAMRKEFEGRHHADIAHEYFTKLGFTETAEAIRLHRFTAVLEEPHAFNTLEKKLVHYADKRCAHDQIVSLHERFQDGRERYKKFNTPQMDAAIPAIEQKTIELENELFKPLALKPTDLR